MKKKILSWLFALLFLVGFGVYTYPVIANQWNMFRQSQLIASYEDAVEEMTTEDFSAEWDAARCFTSEITQNNIFA